MGIELDWNSPQRSYIVATVSKGWQVEDVVAALANRHRMINEVPHTPGLLIQIDSSFGIPPPRLLSRLRRIKLDGMALDQMMVVCAPPHQIAFLENLLFLAMPRLLETLKFTSDPQEAVNWLQQAGHSA